MVLPGDVSVKVGRESSLSALQFKSKEKPIMKQYLLLMPLKASDLSIEKEEFAEAAAEWGAKLVVSKTITGATTRFLITQTLEAMAQLCSNCDLEGTVVEVTGIYDQEIEEE